MSDKQLTKQISSLFTNKVLKGKKSFLIIGAGKFGGAIAKKLSSLGKPVLLIDKDQEKVNWMQSEVDNIQCINPTKIRELETLDFSAFDNCVVSLGSSIDDSFVTVLNIKQLRPDLPITVKSSTAQQTSILQALKVANIVHPEQEVAKREALELVFSNAKDVVEVGSDFLFCHTEVKNISLKGMPFSEYEKKYTHNIRFVMVYDPKSGAQKFVAKNDGFEMGTTVHFITRENQMEEISDEIALVEVKK